MDVPAVSLCDRYYFELTDDIDPPQEEELLQDLDSIERDLHQIETTQREISGSLYSYSAPQKTVLATHRKWNKEVGSLFSKLTECNIRISHLHKGLLFLPFHAIRVPMCRVYQLELKIGQSQTQINQLSLLLQSQIYGEAIILYKKTIDDCESVYDKYQKQQQQQAELQKINKIVSQELGSRRKSLSTLSQELTIQTEIIYEALIKLLEHASSLSPRPEEDLLTAAINQHMQKITITAEDSQLVDLRDDLSLCPGVGWLQKNAMKLANYSTMSLVDKLEGEAKELQILHNALKSKLEATYQGNWKYIPLNYNEESEIISSDHASLEVRKLKLEQLCQSLFRLLPTKQIRSGLYYAAHLSTYLAEIRLIFTHFAKNMSIDNKDIILALNITYECLANFLTTNQKKRRTEKIETIFFAAHSIARAAQLKNSQKTSPSLFNVQVITDLETIVARLGKEVLKAPIDADTQVWLAVVSGQTKGLGFSMGCHVSMHMKQYIEKEITQWLYFSKAPSHIRLDMMLHSVKKLDEVPSFFNDQAFKDISSCYTPQYPEWIISIFCSIFKLAYSFNPSMINAEPYIFSYSKCIAYLYMAKSVRDSSLHQLEKTELAQLILEAEAQLECNQKASESPLESPIEPSEMVMKDFISGKINFTGNNHILLHLLAKALWLPEDNKKEFSDLLHAFFLKSNSNFFVLNTSEPINYLIAEFALTRANRNEPLCPFEEVVVKSVLTVYQTKSLFLAKRLKKQCAKLSPKFL